MNLGQRTGVGKMTDTVLMNANKAIAKHCQWIKERYEETKDEKQRAYLRGYLAGMHFVNEKLWK